MRRVHENRYGSRLGPGLALGPSLAPVPFTRAFTDFERRENPRADLGRCSTNSQVTIADLSRRSLDFRGDELRPPTAQRPRQIRATTSPGGGSRLDAPDSDVGDFDPRLVSRGTSIAILARPQTRTLMNASPRRNRVMMFCHTMSASHSTCPAQRRTRSRSSRAHESRPSIPSDSRPIPVFMNFGARARPRSTN